MTITFIKGLSDTSNRGNLSKAWYEINGQLHLVKGNTIGTLGSLGTVCYEPYSEYLAYKIASIFGFDHVPYTLMEKESFPEVVCHRIAHVSVCPLMGKKGDNYISLAKLKESLIKRSELVSRDLYRSNISFLNHLQTILPREEMHKLFKLLLFDALIGNEDRHLNNIELLITPQGYQIAPIYDSGASLLAWRYRAQLPLAGIRYMLDNARPFFPTHREQIESIPQGIYPKMDLESKTNQVLYTIGSLAPQLGNYKVKAIQKYFTWRLEYIKEVMG